MRIAEAAERDIPLIRELAGISWRANYDGLLSTGQIEYMLEMMYSEAELRLQFHNPDYRYFLLGAEEDVVAGFIGFQLNYEPSTTKLHRLYLLKNHKGRGLGKGALDFLKEQVKTMGNERIILNVNRNNAARNFYQAQGFQVYDEGVFDIGNGFVMDDWLMEYLV